MFRLERISRPLTTEEYFAIRRNNKRLFALLAENVLLPRGPFYRYSFLYRTGGLGGEFSGIAGLRLRAWRFRRRFHSGLKYSLANSPTYAESVRCASVIWGVCSMRQYAMR